MLPSKETGLLVDITDFLLRDAHSYALGRAYSVANRLKESNQGTYQLDKSRSAIYLERTKSFPENTEFEATLTFGLKEGDNYGELGGLSSTHRYGCYSSPAP